MFSHGLNNVAKNAKTVYSFILDFGTINLKPKFSTLQYAFLMILYYHKRVYISSFIAYMPKNGGN